MSISVNICPISIRVEVNFETIGKINVIDGAVIIGNRILFYQSIRCFRKMRRYKVSSIFRKSTRFNNI